jgi:hypothetical protein
VFLATFRRRSLKPDFEMPEVWKSEARWQPSMQGIFCSGLTKTAFLVLNKRGE